MTDCNIFSGFKSIFFWFGTILFVNGYKDWLCVYFWHSPYSFRGHKPIINHHLNTPDSLKTGWSAVYPGTTLTITTPGFQALREIMTLIKFTLQYLYAEAFYSWYKMSVWFCFRAPLERLLAVDRCPHDVTHGERKMKKPLKFMLYEHLGNACCFCSLK